VAARGVVQVGDATEPGRWPRQGGAGLGLDRGVAGVEVHDERLVVGVRGDRVRIPRGIAELRGQFVVRRLGVEYGVAAEQERGYGQARADNNEDCQRDPVRPAARPGARPCWTP
jgi:hypothetical protein